MPRYTTSNKIINDPVYGLIPMPGGIAFDLVNHPWFQRLRHIRQLGLTHYVYPGALHTRFQHTLGSVYLMQLAIDVLESKYIDISPAEADGVILAILLHDIGHGPMSHALEGFLLPGCSHEEISLQIALALNQQLDDKLETAVEIFTNRYPKKFLHQLVSSQLDTDRLDYLIRDSFFTGVSEGVVSTDRIIKMLNVKDDNLVVDQKGIYSVEKFLIARRLMYWQVYLHKTVIAAEQMLRNVIRRARMLSLNGEHLFGSPALLSLLSVSGKPDSQILEYFLAIDDDDIMSALKAWANHSDFILSYLAQGIQQRKLFRVRLSNRPFNPQLVSQIKEMVANRLILSNQEVEFLVQTDVLSNSAYKPADDQILILTKNGTTVNLLDESDMFNHEVMSKPVLKYYLCYPKEFDNLLTF